MPNDAIRDSGLVRATLIRNIFPDQSSQGWICLFFVPLDFRSIDGRSIMIPGYLKVSLEVNGQSQSKEKLVVIQDNIHKTINLGLVEPSFKELLVKSSFAEPPLQYQNAFIEYEEFLEQLKAWQINLYLAK